MTPNAHADRRRIALGAICLGVFMIMLDGSIVTVAIPSIKASLGFSETSLVWLINGYMVTFGGFQLLSGRLSDVLGARRLFLTGISAFTIASLLCGLAHSQAGLIGSRAAQGLAGSMVNASGLALCMRMFTASSERAWSMGICTFAASASGGIGILIGGVITTSVNWHWIFLVNVPVGVGVLMLCISFVDASPPGALSNFDMTDQNSSPAQPPLDLPGAVLVTTSMVIAVHTLVNVNHVGWLSLRTIGALLAFSLAVGTLLKVERSSPSPLIPLELLQSRALIAANICSILWLAAVSACNVACALYLQEVLGRSAQQVATILLPANIVTGILSLCLSGRIVARFGVRRPFAGGLLPGVLGLTLLANAPMDDSVILTHFIPGTVLLGVSAGIAFNPMLLAAMSAVEGKNYGVAAGLVGTSSVIGGALGLATLMSVADAHTQTLANTGVEHLTAQTSGYHLLFSIGAALTAAAGLLGAALLPRKLADVCQHKATAW